MANETLSTLDGFFKEVYADKLEHLVPEFAILSQDFDFKPSEKIGDSYHFPVRVRRSHGWTYNGSSPGTAFALNTPIAGQTKDATVQGSEFVNRVQPAYGVISRAKSSKEAFGNAMDEIVMDMIESGNLALELPMLYGASDVGTIETNTHTATTTVSTWIISKATWAAGLWAQMEGAPLDVYDAAGGTQVNTNAVVLVTSVNPSTRAVTVSGNATDLDAVSTSDVLIPRGADGEWFNGLDKITTNTGSLFGIDASTYSLWKANTKSAASAAATFATFTQAMSECVVRGGLGGMTFYVSTYTWTDIANDLSALRRYNEDTTREMKLGTNKVQFVGPGGEIEIKAHPMVKAGEAFGVQKKFCKRIGSSDLTFSLGIEGQNSRFFRELPDNAGFELRNYYDQAFIITRPATAVKVTGIVNNSL